MMTIIVPEWLVFLFIGMAGMSCVLTAIQIFLRVQTNRLRKQLDKF